MRIAVIIPAFNVAPYLRLAIQSVVDQTRSDWLLIVVDDGSSDGTASVATSFKDRRIKLIRQDNAGVSAARNTGIRLAMASAPDAFVFLDGDDWLAPDALAVLADTLDRSPTAVAACGRYARVARNDVPRLSAAPAQGYLLERLLIRNLFANGGHVLIRREAIETAGGFREDLCFGEDWEYWTRLALLGAFVAVRARSPILFVRERPGSACRSNATDPTAYGPAINAIHRNPAISGQLGDARVGLVRRQAQAEMAWTVGRELIRHGRHREGRIWLARSLFGAPRVRRLLLAGLAWFSAGPFRPYQTSSPSG